MILKKIDLGNSLNEEIVYGNEGETCSYKRDQHGFILQRDPIGARALYYHKINKNEYLVSNDLAWIVNQLKVKSINLDYILNEYLQFQIPFSNETPYNDVYRVMSGEKVIINNVDMVRKQYWDIKFGEEPFRAEILRELLICAVNKRKKWVETQCGNNFTTYLSGGLDSSTITMLAMPQNVFSGFYQEEDYSEQDYIGRVLLHAKGKIKNNPISIIEEGFNTELKNLPIVMPDPMCGLGVIPQVIVAQYAKRMGYQYAFTGEGGDEIFTGYNWNTIVFELAIALRRLHRDRYMVRYDELVDSVSNGMFMTMAGGLLGRGDNILKAVEKIKSIWDNNQPVENNIFKINVKVGLPAILGADERVGLYSDILPISPLIDIHIVEYIASIRAEERNNIPKFFLREATKGILPEKIRMRYEKMGFPVPFKEWNWPTLKPMLESLKKRGLYNVGEIEENPKMTRKNWAYFNLEGIIQKYIGE